MLITIKNVAEEAKVSAMTVSRVLNRSANVSDKTKERVLAAIQKLKYQPNQAARIIRGGQANILGVLIPDFTNPFYSHFLKCIEEAAIKLGFRLLITSNNIAISQIENVQYLLSRNVDAIIVCSYSEIKDAAKYLLNTYRDIPTVILDKIDADSKTNSVYADGFTGIKNIVEYLISLGHKKIAMIKGQTNYLIANDRFLGYQEALRLHNIEFNNSFVWEGNYTMQAGVLAVDYFLSLKNRPTAIVASSDYMAIGAINQLMQRGYAVPDDFSVTGYDGLYMGEIVRPHLTTVKLPIEEMAQKIVDILLDEIIFHKKEKVAEVYNGNLLIGDSTAVCRTT